MTRSPSCWVELNGSTDSRAPFSITSLPGIQQIAYGRPRGSVIGMKVALSDGTMIKAGGRVVKNVAGYDLCKLFTGSYGTLGVITEINFKLRPVPERHATVVATGEADVLVTAGQLIVRGRLFPVAAELVSRALAAKLGIAGEKCALLLRFAGNMKAVTYQAENALKSLRDDPDISTTELINDDDVLWRQLAAVPLSKDSNLAWRVTVLPVELPGFLKSAGQLMGTRSNDLIWHAGVGDGRMRCLDRSAAIPEQLEHLRNAARTAGGRLVIEKGARLSVDPLSSTQQLGERVKQQLDPSGVFPSLSY